MSDYLKKAENLLSLFEKENKQLELDFDKNKCGADEYWCDKDKKCKKKSKFPEDKGGYDREHPLAESDMEVKHWKELDELTDKLRMMLASCGEHKISSAGGHRLNINGIVIRVEGRADDAPGLSGITRTR